MLLVFNNYHTLALKINSDVIAHFKGVKLLGVTIDSQLNFNNHVKAICVNAKRKVSAFARVAGYIDIQNAKSRYQSFVASKFKYCPLIWVLTSEKQWMTT